MKQVVETTPSRESSTPSEGKSTVKPVVETTIFVNATTRDIGNVKLTTPISKVTTPDSLSTTFSTQVSSAEKLFTTSSVSTISKVITIAPTVDILNFVEDCPMQIQCYSESMKVVVQKADLKGFSFGSLRVLDTSPQCLPFINTTHIIFNVPLYGCGTVRKYLDNAILYENKVSSISHNIFSSFFIIFMYDHFVS